MDPSISLRLSKSASVHSVPSSGPIGLHSDLLPSDPLFSYSETETTDFISSVSRLFADVRNLQNEAGRKEGARTDGWFDARIGELISDLESKISAPHSDFLQQHAVLLTKHAFLTCIKDSLKTLISPRLLPLIKKIDSLDSELFTELAEIALDLAQNSMGNSAKDREDCDLVRLDSDSDPPRHAKTSSQTALIENLSLKARVDCLEKEVTKLGIDKERTEGLLREELEAAVNTQIALKSELKGYHDLLQRERVRTVEQEALALECDQLKSRLDFLLRSKTRDSYPQDGHRPEDVRSFYHSVSQERMRGSRQVGLRASTGGDSKVISLKNVVGTIAEVYASKGKNDWRNRENHEPIETMSEHLQAYLNTKYGLKVKGKLLAAIKEVQTELGRRRKRMDESQPAQKQATHLTLAEARSVTEMLFPPEDTEILQSVLSDYMQQYMVRKADFHIGKQSNREAKVTVETFLNVVMKYRMQQYAENITGFLRAFQKVDEDSDGRITQSEFRALLAELQIPLQEPEILSLLRAIDPFNIQQMTLSSCASLFQTSQHRGVSYISLFR